MVAAVHTGSLLETKTNCQAGQNCQIRQKLLLTVGEGEGKRLVGLGQISLTLNLKANAWSK